MDGSNLNVGRYSLFHLMLRYTIPFQFVHSSYSMLMQRIHSGEFVTGGCWM